MQKAKFTFSKLGIWLGAIALIAGLLLYQGFYRKIGFKSPCF